jgi:hypothetical protein
MIHLHVDARGVLATIAIIWFVVGTAVILGGVLWAFWAVLWRAVRFVELPVRRRDWRFLILTAICVGLYVAGAFAVHAADSGFSVTGLIFGLPLTLLFLYFLARGFNEVLWRVVRFFELPLRRHLSHRRHV